MATGRKKCQKSGITLHKTLAKTRKSPKTCYEPQTSSPKEHTLQNTNNDKQETGLVPEKGEENKMTDNLASRSK